MKIAVIGAGRVGGALGTCLAAKGHEVSFGVRDTGNPQYAQLKLNPRTEITSPQRAVEDAPVVILATPWVVTREAIEGCGSLAGKILVDCTNPIRADSSGLEEGPLSGGETVARWATHARVVKCFNQTGFENMLDPSYGQYRPMMLAAGDDAEAVKTVVSLAEELGFEGIGVEGLKRSRQLEQLGWLWIDLAIRQRKGRRFAFAVVRR
jgi:predicted dinucleotide-binding enzyme